MDENKKGIKFEGWQVLILIILTVIITTVASYFLWYWYLDSKKVIVTSYNENSTLEEKLNVIRTKLEQDYLRNNEIDNQKLIDSALKGYVAGVGDEYTEFMTKDEFENLTEQLSDYTGIGVYVAETKNNEVIILAPVGKESPAFKAGIEAGDIIIKINDEDVTELDLQKIVSKMKGQEGTKVKITVKRDDKELEFEVTRKNIKVSEITSKMLDNNIGYIDFDSFTETAATEFLNEYNSLKSKGAKKLIIDLRNNTGGYVPVAQEIMDLFLNKGEIEFITVDNKKNEITNIAKKGKTIDMPVVILTNEYTASASEILTGCLKDHGIAKVVGTKTYGKGVIQTIDKILDGEAYLKLTTMKYLTPNKNEINEVGIKPGKEVELKEDKDRKDGLDNQIDEAIKLLK